MFRQSTIIAVVCALVCAPGAAAQTVLDRTPNLDGAWVGASGMLHFNFLHRFSASSEPERKVTSTPTFLLAAGLPHKTLIGAYYASNSELSPRYPNEWEFFGRIAVLDQRSGAPLDLSAQVGYNLAADQPDGELALARRQGPVRLLGVARLLGDPADSGGADVALGSGVVLRLSRYIALVGRRDHAGRAHRARRWPGGRASTWRFHTHRTHALAPRHQRQQREPAERLPRNRPDSLRLRVHHPNHPEPLLRRWPPSLACTATTGT